MKCNSCEIDTQVLKEKKNDKCLTIIFKALIINRLGC